ncbi:unnamed protein product [Allacma fusca]|uniref:Uncharacterized protein n=1 Tax=Allacma fusca TaxID=39272 RepID=A0A8J2NVI4_9HEXA|nr:unnamed protein product [Allacma fusca]
MVAITWLFALKAEAIFNPVGFASGLNVVSADLEPSTREQVTKHIIVGEALTRHLCGQFCKKHLKGHYIRVKLCGMQVLAEAENWRKERSRHNCTKSPAEPNTKVMGKLSFTIRAQIGVEPVWVPGFRDYNLRGWWLTISIAKAITIKNQRRQQNNSVSHHVGNENFTFHDNASTTNGAGWNVGWKVKCR